MKTKIQYIIGIIILSSFAFQTNAIDNNQNTIQQTVQAPAADTLKVWGNCDMCKKTIETSAKKVTGVKSAVWDVKTKKLTVAYTDKTKRSEVQQAIAKAGYDTQDVKAYNEAYNKLPSCCQYKRK